MRGSDVRHGADDDGVVAQNAAVVLDADAGGQRDEDFIVQVVSGEFVQYRFHLCGFDAEDEVVAVFDELAVIGMGIYAVDLFEGGGARRGATSGVDLFAGEAVFLVCEQAANDRGAHVAGAEKTDGCCHGRVSLGLSG